MSRLISVMGVLLFVLTGCHGEPHDDPLSAGTEPVSKASTGDIAHLVAVRLDPEDRYDTLVLEFADRIPGYTIGYQPLPARADASGFEIPLPGANNLVQITLNPATADGWAGGQRTYFGPSAVSADTEVVTEAKAAGDFEATLTWVVGLRSEVPFRVQELQDPPRIEVDFKRHGD
jgi:hypothetical protein